MRPRSPSNECGTGLKPVFAPASSRCPTGPHRLETGATPAFTLIELVVVIAIIVALLGVVLPSVSRMWDGRKQADSVNRLRGAITLARRMALSPDHDEVGLLFVRDRLDNNQRIFLIERKPVTDTIDGNRIARDRFVIVDDRDYTLPAPLRVAPRYAVDAGGDDEFLEFNDAELIDESFPGPDPNIDWDEGQRHRNYFSMIFNGQGRLVVGRNVLIHDTAPTGGDGVARFGDRTGLPLPNADIDPVDQYFARDSHKRNRKLPIDQTGTQPALTDLAVDSNDGTPVAINFPSVDGLLLYDDAAFRRMGDAQSKREFLMRTAQPLYVAGVSGLVILGPIVENEVPQ